ncbi:MAG TPA: hypothetical protein VMV57_14900 [Terracidiphilus sp.]|nr:hypothetical protein [Terracidiphilus sp.]
MPTMITWSERTYYSMDLDCQVSRVSGFDDHHQEHWIVIEMGKGYRDRRLAAVERIMASIEARDPPGEVPLEE